MLAADWPQWRGPNRDGIAAGTAPAAFPEKLTRRWSLPVGEGHSSPVLAAGRIYLLSREGENEIVRAIDPAAGKVLWQQSYPAPFKINSAATAHGAGPKSTPLVAGGKLFTFGISGVLSCFDAASGKTLWRRDFKSEHKATWPDFGTATSPMVDGNVVIAFAGTDTDGALTAFDVNTGTPKWKWFGDGPAYASPILVELGGVRQIVTQSHQNIVGVSAQNGELLWKIGYRTIFEQNTVTPIAYGQLLLVSGLDNGLMALKVTRGAKGWQTERLWDNAQASMYMSTGVLSGDVLYGFGHRNKGQFLAVDARSGKTLWTSPGRQAENAALVRQGEYLYLLKDDAELLVARANPASFDVVRRYTVADSPTWAHPLLVDGGVVIKDKSTLAFWSWK